MNTINPLTVEALQSMARAMDAASMTVCQFSGVLGPIARAARGDNDGKRSRRARHRLDDAWRKFEQGYEFWDVRYWPSGLRPTPRVFNAACERFLGRPDEEVKR